MVTNRLVPEAGGARAKLGYAPMIAEVNRSISHVYAFIGMRGTTEELELRAANLWVLPVDENYNYCGAALDGTDRAVSRQGDAKNPWSNCGNDDDVDDILIDVVLAD